MSWANRVAALRDDLIVAAQRRIAPQARGYPFSLLRCATGPADPLAQARPFLRLAQFLTRVQHGRRLVGALLARSRTPASLIDRLYAMEAANASR